MTVLFIAPASSHCEDDGTFVDDEGHQVTPAIFAPNQSFQGWFGAFSFYDVKTTHILKMTKFEGLEVEDDANR